jgi:micrococcal nuclease
LLWQPAGDVINKVFVKVEGSNPPGGRFFAPSINFSLRHSIMLEKILVILNLFYVLSGTFADAREAFNATVMKVIDGDSLLITTGGRNIEVRLYGIDAPEYKQPFAEEAKKYIRQWIGWQRVMVQPEYVDSYGRTVAVVVRGEQVLNRDLVQAGLAWVYPRYCRKDVCKIWKEKENKARSEKKGLWHDRQPIAPWTWKRL